MCAIRWMDVIGAIVEIKLSTISFNDLGFMHTPRLTIHVKLLLSIRYALPFMNSQSAHTKDFQL